ncbi:MAG: aminopeptidase [Clostridia bacterium]|nr:aminopeptidase [Clostridia bacterium]
MNKTKLRKYAALIAKCGINVQKKQNVIIQAELDQPEFVEMLVKECYKAGAGKVFVEWTHQPLTALNVRYCTEKALGTLEDWQIKKWEWQADTLPAKIFLTSEDPDGLAGINQKKFAAASAKRSMAIKPIRRRMENKFQWCIAAVPGKGWAKKVFPGERTSVAVEKLWEAIFTASRVTEDPIAEWDKHNKDLAKRCEYLNSIGIKELHYTASNGTDLKVGMLEDALFMAGGEHTQGSGIYFNPNIPTEEAFTSPKRGEAEGIVYSSLPLSYGGQLINNFWFRFEGGKIVDCGAEENVDMLREMISMDEGASYLGEVALVPYSSPIRESGILFYNTLFDENAACHLAIGMGFTNVLKDAEKYTDEEARAKGINDSITHVDFMIGTKDMSITALCRDGKTVSIFKDGEWAF